MITITGPCVPKPEPSQSPVPFSIFPTFETLEDVMAYAKEMDPELDHNTLYAILATQHNTTLGQTNEQSNQDN